MHIRPLRSLVIAVVIAVAAAACGGAAAPNTNEPAGTVKAAFEAAQSGGVARMVDFACAARKDDVTQLFGGGASSLTALGISLDEVLSAMKVEFKDLQTTEKSKSGTTAVVHVTGTSTITFDPAKMREIVKKVLAAQGQPADDATIDVALNAMGSQLTQTQTLDEDVNVVQEGGTWLLCR